MQIEIATLFPEMCEAVLSESIIGRARAAGHISVRCWNIREYTLDKHRRVDDVPYGGGRGMVMQADPIYRCYDAVQQDIGARPHVIYMSPKGRVLDQQRALELSVMPHIFVLCGHYEGVDQRILDEIVDEELSIGAHRRGTAGTGAGGYGCTNGAGCAAGKSLLRGRKPLRRTAGISPVYPSGGVA